MKKRAAAGETEGRTISPSADWCQILLNHVEGRDSDLFSHRHTRTPSVNSLQHINLRKGEKKKSSSMDPWTTPLTHPHTRKPTLCRAELMSQL